MTDKFAGKVPSDYLGSKATPPSDFADCGDVMSNFDHEVEPYSEEKLKSGKWHGGYAAWNFHGTVWWNGSNFQCAVKCYNVHVATIAAPTLEELMDSVSSVYGYD